MSTPTNIPVTFEIDRSYFKAVSEAMSSEETRYYLCGIHFQARGDKLIMEATDGHVLLRATLDAPGLPISLDFIMPAELVQHICKAKYPRSAKYHPVEVTLDGRDLTVSCNNQTFGSQIIDATFPDADRVIPSKCEGGFARFNPYLLMRLNKAGEILNGGTPREAKRWITLHTNANDIAAVTIENHPEMLGVIMPMRPDVDERANLAKAMEIAGKVLEEPDANNDRNLREVA